MSTSTIAERKKTRRIVLRSTGRPKPAPREKPVPVIIEVAADGFLTIYGPRHVRPIVFNRLVAVRPEEANIVDAFHEFEIPRPFREVYCPRNVLKTHNIERRTLEKEITRRERLAMLRDFRGLAKACEKGDRK